MLGLSNFCIESFMYIPYLTTGVTNKDEIKPSTYTINVFPMLMLRTIPQNYTDSANFKDRTFKVTPKNHYKVMKFFNTVVGWFYDKSKNDLFVTDENNALIFNNDYNGLTLAIEDSYRSGKIMQATPIVMKFDTKYYEGINLCINNIENTVSLTLFDLESILGVLQNFSWQDEILLLSNLYVSSVKMGRVMDNVPQNYNNRPSYKPYRKNPFGV